MADDLPILRRLRQWLSEGIGEDMYYKRQSTDTEWHNDDY